MPQMCMASVHQLADCMKGCRENPFLHTLTHICARGEFRSGLSAAVVWQQGARSRALRWSVQCCSSTWRPGAAAAATRPAISSGAAASPAPTHQISAALPKPVQARTPPSKVAFPPHLPRAPPIACDLSLSMSFKS